MKNKKKLVVIFISTILILSLILLLNLKNVGRNPEIHSISTSVVNPGDIITLYGNYFGGEISRGRIFINDKMLFNDSIESWNNKTITITLPQDFKSGMVIISNMFGSSNSYLLTSISDVPTIVDRNVGSAFISSASYLDDSDIEINIDGRGFGDNRSDSILTVLGLRGEEILIDYNSIILWNDNSIIFSLPYSMNNIVILIESNSRISNEYTLHNNSIPSVVYIKSDAHKINILQKIDVMNIVTLDNSFIDIFIPLAYQNYSQSVNYLDINKNDTGLYKNTYIKSLELKDSGEEFFIELETEIESWNTETKIRKDLIGRVYSKGSPEYLSGFQKTPNIDEFNQDIYNTSTWLIRNSRNRYNQAEIIINWILKYIDLNTGVTDSASNAFKNRETSEFGLVNLSVAMLRSIGIPSRIVRGVIIQDEVNLYQWAEFYLPNGGWIPLDILELEKDDDYIIGFLEYNRIGFTRGVTNIDYNIENFDKNLYALQNSTTKSHGNVENYETVWHNVVVK